MAEVREAIVSEVEDIVDLWLKMGTELHPEATPDKDAWVRLIQGLYKSGKYRIVVAEEAGRLIGFVDGLVYYEPSTGQETGISQFIYVLPEYRMTDVAPRLYDLIVKIVNGAGAMVIQTTCDARTKGMWERKGFVVERFIMSKKVEV